VFDDGAALFESMCELGLEGVVAKREREAYRAGDRRWVKVKNRSTVRYAEELARRAPRRDAEHEAARAS